MPKPELPFDTAPYDRLPISTFVYEPVRRDDGVLDFRIAYANEVFARDWREIYKNDDYIGALLKQSTLMDDYSLDMMERFCAEPPRSFSTYMPLVSLHLHFQPMLDLPAPYAGFFLTNLTDYEEQEARVHFLRNIRQMQNSAVLLRVHDDYRLEAVFVSEDFAKMMECSVEEAKRRMDGAGFITSTHPEDRPLVRSMLKRRVSDEGTHDLTVQKITAKGRAVWCDVHFAFIDDFREHYVYCTYFDVTVLKVYEERLRNAYMNLGSNFYQLTDRTLGLLRVNLTRDVVEDLKGADLFSSDAIGRSYAESMRERAAHYPIRAEWDGFLSAFSGEALMNGYLEGRMYATRMLYSHRANGNRCYVRFEANVTRHPMTGDIIAFITEQECNDEKVSETLTSDILARQFDMVAYLAEKRYGIVIGEAANIPRGSIFPLARSGDYQKYLEDQVFPVLSGTEAQKAEARAALALETVEAQVRERRPYVASIACDIDGEVWYKRFDFYAVDPEARFYIILKSDTTELHREQEAYNEQLRSALAEAQQANVAKTAFLSSMSHEIRTPMNAIIGLDNIALKEPNLPARTREQLEKIGGSARHLLGLINDILDMSRIESGRMVLKSEEFSFSGMLEQINTMIGGQCQDRGLTYECHIRGKVADYYIGDDMKLKQVLINILGNAVKFTPAPGTVSFLVEQTARFEDKSTLRFVIKDTGIGMDKEYLPKIFEAFTQEDATTTNKYGGSGLGMAITKNIVEMMSGNISVDSEKGVGSEFTVNVTLRNSDRRESGEPDVRPQDLDVLVVDDDPVACEHAKTVLEEIGITADTAGSGAEAMEMIRLRHARRAAYNLILVDWKMPEQDGLAVTKAIRAEYNGESTIVILTAYNWADIEEEALSAGVDSFMAKPLFASNVLYEFRQAMERKRQKEAETAAPVDLTGRRILLAEDMLINAEIMKELLGMRDMEVEHAENGQEAVDLFAARPENYFDAILMDVRMPVLDGLGATEAIRALDRPDAKTVPIIAMTANAFDEDVQRSLQAGMNAHLSKPVEPDRLYETLAGLIRAKD